jgi:hypothetical protein
MWEEIFHGTTVGRGRTVVVSQAREEERLGELVRSDQSSSKHFQGSAMQISRENPESVPHLGVEEDGGVRARYGEDEMSIDARRFYRRFVFCKASGY